MRTNTSSATIMRNTKLPVGVEVGWWGMGGGTDGMVMCYVRVWMVMLRNPCGDILYVHESQ